MSRYAVLTADGLDWYDSLGEAQEAAADWEKGYLEEYGKPCDGDCVVLAVVGKSPGRRLLWTVYSPSWVPPEAQAVVEEA